MNNKIVYMVAVIYDGKQVCGYRLFDVASEKLADVSKQKLIRLLQNGYSICNIKLGSREVIESSSLNCSLKRYTAFNLDGSLKSKNINRVLVARYNGSNGVASYLVFDSLQNRIDIVDGASVANLDSPYDFVANAATIDADVTVSDKEKFEVYWKEMQTRYKKFKYSLNNLLVLEDFAMYVEGDENPDFVVDNCIVVNKMHHVKARRLILDKLVYAIGYRAISNIQVESLELNEIAIIESQFLRDSKIGTLSISGTTWYSGTDAIVNCEINRIELGEDIIITNNFLVDSKVHEIQFKGKHPSLNRGMRTLFKNSNIDYVIIDSNIADDEYERLSSLVGAQAKIIME
jgi:hypothetical protein